MDINSQTGEETEAVPPLSRAEQDQVVLAVDGNSLVHRSYHSQAGTGLHGAERRPDLGSAGAAHATGRRGRSLPTGCRRRRLRRSGSELASEKWPQYKANRSDKLPTAWCASSRLPRSVLRDLGVGVIVPAGLEADDVLASAAACRRCSGWYHRDRYVRSRRLRAHRRGHARAAHHQRWRRVFAADHGRATGLAARRPARPIPGLRRVTR